MLYVGEQFCDYKTALILNEIIRQKKLEIKTSQTYKVYVTLGNAFYENSDTVVTSIPTYTHQKAIDIIRNELKIFIGLDFEYDQDTREYYFYSIIITLDTNEYVTKIGAFSPEDAQEAAILEALMYYCNKNCISVSLK